MPIPLFIEDRSEIYPATPFDLKPLCEKFHVVLVSKPGVPLLANIKDLQNDYNYLDSHTHLPPAEYLKNDHLTYYTNRNLYIIDFLLKKGLANANQTVAAGHSQGARIALHMALQSKLITHLIYAGGNPYGQITSMIASSRKKETLTDTINFCENTFNYYASILKKESVNPGQNDDSDRSVLSFSNNSVKDFAQLQIPILVTYGSKDPSAPYLDLLRIEMIQQSKYNLSFKSYTGLEHNFFGTNENGETNYNNFNWNKIVEDWLRWLQN